MLELRLSILGISGAFTKVGPVAQMLKETIEACALWAHGLGVEASTDIVHLSDVITECTVPEQSFIPPHLMAVVEKLGCADVVVFATPVMWSAMTPLLSAFFVGLTACENDFDYPFRGKVAGVIAHCDEDGGEKVVGDVLTPLRHLGFLMPPHAGFWRNRTGARFSEEEWQMHDHTHVLAPNLVELAVALKKAKPEWR